MAGAADTPPPTGPMGATGAAPGAIYKPFDALSNASILNGTKGHPFFLASLWDLFDARKLQVDTASAAAHLALPVCHCVTGTLAAPGQPA